MQLRHSRPEGGDLVDDNHRNPALAVDAISLRVSNSGTEVLLIRRVMDPWKGKLAFPGGFVDRGEDPEEAVLRELLEETGVSGSNPEVFAVRGKPFRDPRKHIVSVFYIVNVEGSSDPVAGDDAAEAEWILIENLERGDMAGDHIEVIEQLRK